MRDMGMIGLVIIQTPPLYSMFDARYWMLDARCQMKQGISLSRIQHPETSIQHRLLSEGGGERLLRPELFAYYQKALSLLFNPYKQQGARNN